MNIFAINMTSQKGLNSKKPISIDKQEIGVEFSTRFFFLNFISCAQIVIIQ
jgi:hypothetical protein